MPLKSTMGAILNYDEERRILDAWGNLVTTGNLMQMHTDAVQMLDSAGDLVGLVSELRSAIYNGWHKANARAFPAPAKKPRREQETFDVVAMQQEIDDLISQIQAAKESR